MGTILEIRSSRRELGLHCAKEERGGGGVQSEGAVGQTRCCWSNKLCASPPAAGWTRSLGFACVMRDHCTALRAVHHSSMTASSFLLGCGWNIER